METLIDDLKKIVIAYLPTDTMACDDFIYSFKNDIGGPRGTIRPSTGEIIYTFDYIKRTINSKDIGFEYAPTNRGFINKFKKIFLRLMTIYGEHFIYEDIEREIYFAYIVL
tara:strand:+ start:1640 stop:1972 length:333 start_codon:yes stop_codon:yes gene_type:complete